MPPRKKRAVVARKSMCFLFDSLLTNLPASTVPGPAPILPIPTSKKAKAKSAKAGPVLIPASPPASPLVPVSVPAPVPDDEDPSDMLRDVDMLREMGVGVSQPRHEIHGRYVYADNDDDDDDDDDDEFEGMSAVPCPQVTCSLLF
jgi:hypothetical protein